MTYHRAHNFGRFLSPAGIAVLIFFSSPLFAQSAEEVTSAESTFKFISSNLQNFQRTGRIDDAIGIDGSEYQFFIELLQDSYAEFSEYFSPQSSFCDFYLDPMNGIMEIEERAGVAFEYIPELAVRLENYINLDQEFQGNIAESFGTIVLERIRQMKLESTSFEYLPTWELDSSEILGFADTACR